MSTAVRTEVQTSTPPLSRRSSGLLRLTTFLRTTLEILFDFLDTNCKPYLVAVTALIESPMKMFIQNQNYSNILFGSNDKELVKNVVRFEANVRWTDLLKVLPVNNKPSLKWKITDFNNLMNENPTSEPTANQPILVI